MSGGSAVVNKTMAAAVLRNVPAALTTLLTLGSEATIVEIRFANTSNASGTVSVAIFDGTNTTYLAKTYAVAASDVAEFATNGIPLRPGDILQVAADGANKYDAIAVYSQ
jgi:hypothetical protein